MRVSSAGRRFGGYLLDTLLLFVTAFIGWLIWSLIIWGRGQTPAKQILGMRVVHLQTMTHATWGRMALREIVGKGLIGIVVWATVLGIVLWFWLLWDAQRQELWDKIANTIVVDDQLNQLA
jgi:uncharacterized RDD family membrane protein YckC